MRQILRSRTPGAAAATLGIVLTLQACGPAAQAPPEEPSSAVAVDAGLIEKGREIYRANCVPCHGPSGRGDGPAAASLNPKPRNHADPELMEGISDRRIAETVRMGGIISGFPNMPASPHIKGEELVALVAFVRSLHRPEVVSVDLEGVGQES